ncbi:hypothetical protein GCM10022631_11770 [Deinococcus rubellus]|uniref:Uncharacterized protein n=1 Tax=Deinococcus rubellus TaxID=1889240 RepID=A0ABY5YCP4_9DEIO|nr:hypothetical protein [Deinococcus rubellus]UWX62778.1 hypothetical protein N0D28_08325 [Deinococcus rubellus]
MNPPLPSAEALTHLTDALGVNYAAPTDQDTLTRALSVDGVTVEGVFYARPWATAARLIADNTEYEVGGELNAQIDRKLKTLLRTQLSLDAAQGISAYVPSQVQAWPPMGGPVNNEEVW